MLSWAPDVPGAVRPAAVVPGGGRVPEDRPLCGPPDPGAGDGDGWMVGNSWPTGPPAPGSGKGRMKGNRLLTEPARS